jgi:hypothetical protein
MVNRKFSLSARIDTDSPAFVEPILRKLAKGGTVERGGSRGEFVVRVEMTGEASKDLNRALLSELRRAEKKTRLRAEWTSPDGTIERYFDYVLKKTTK